jgi:hypothetical protein
MERKGREGREGYPGGRGGSILKRGITQTASTDCNLKRRSSSH